MELQEWMLLGLVFVTVAAMVLGLSGLMSGDRVGNRLRQVSGEAARADGLTSLKQQGVERLADIVQPFSRLAAPEEGFERSALARRLVQAGIRERRGPMVFYGLKACLFIVLPVLAWGFLQLAGSTMAAKNILVVSLVTGAAGYYLPNLLLDRAVKARQNELFENFPDALDLLTICVEAGLGTESALQRVTADIGSKSRVLAEELHLVTVELRAGMDRERALRNLAFRTGVEEIDSFVTLIVQAERFGTSVGAALRVQSDMLRTRRRQRAEEMAAKIGVKLMFPLMFCIFPSLFVVLLLPSGLNMMKAVSSLTGG